MVGMLAPTGALREVFSSVSLKASQESYLGFAEVPEKIGQNETMVRRVCG
jgi:hypothetical protein